MRRGEGPDADPVEAIEVTHPSSLSGTPQASIVDAEARLRRSDLSGVAELLTRATADPATDRLTRARASSAWAMFETLQSRFDHALQWAQQAAELWNAEGDLNEAAMARAIGSRASLALGYPEDAVADTTIALDEAQRGGSLRALMSVTAAFGHIHFVLRQFDQALAYFERALELARTIGDPVAEGNILDSFACTSGNRAVAAQEAGDIAEARRLLTEAITFWERARHAARNGGHRRNEVSALVNHAEALQLLERPEEALALLRSWPLDPDGDAPQVLWHHRDTEGGVCLRLGRYPEAIALLTDAVRYASGNAQALSSCERLSQAHEANGDPVAALVHYKRFHALFQRISSESAQRSARVAAIRLETVDAQRQASEQRHRAERLAVDNDQLTRRADDLAQLSLEDPLTGLANRRMMDKLISADPSGFGVVMIDADHFKRINDDWSHATGDAVLKRLATIMRECCRASDTAIRCGGEEFAVLLPHLNESGALATAERVRRTIEVFDWESVASGLRVTVSIGVASAFEAESTTAVLALADKRLHEAKRSGRNRVVGRRSPAASAT